jgi:hypothetical protein
MNLILYEKSFIFGSILEMVNSIEIKIMKRVKQILAEFIPEQVCLYKKLKFEYLLS